MAQLVKKTHQLLVQNQAAVLPALNQAVRHS
jgi:hypothetical protein